jgi:hypothetical protein
VGSADKGNGFDARILRQRAAGFISQALNGVEDTGRQARLEAILASSVAVSGLHSAGLCTTVQPAAKAGAIFQVANMNGMFHGVMAPTGPIGSRIV